MATLKNLVDETTNIKNELVECYTNLKNNLIAKGVECSDIDKMPTLIDKVASITRMPKCMPGDKHHLHYLELSSRQSTTSYYLATQETAFADGGYRVKTLISSYQGKGGGVRFEIVRNSVVVDYFEENKTGANVTFTKDFTNVANGDIIKIYFKTTGGWGELKNTFISFDFI